MRTDYDVVVVGGGPAGCAAALASARQGMKTLLVERYGFLGGMATAGLVAPFMPVTTDGQTRVIRGIFQEIVDLMVEGNKAIQPEEIAKTRPEACYRTDILPDTTPFEAEELKWVLQELLLKAQVELLLHVYSTAVQVEKGRITGITCRGKEGEFSVRGRYFIDCTGDGDLAVAAGIDYEAGRERDGLTQPATLMFRVGGVDFQSLGRYLQANPRERRLDSLLKVARENGIDTGPRNNILFFATPRPGEVVVNATRIHNVDGTNSASLTKAEIEGRNQVRKIIEFLQKYAPGFQGCYLIETAPQIGIRETRRLKGEYTITRDDVLHGAKFPDAIARACYMIDLHDPSGGDTEMRKLAKGVYYEIPYRALFNRKIANLLWAGRCLSASHVALAALRVMPICFATGQAVGTAAALAAKNSSSVAEVVISDLQKQLRTDGVYL